MAACGAAPPEGDVRLRRKAGSHSRRSTGCRAGGQPARNAVAHVSYVSHVAMQPPAACMAPCTTPRTASKHGLLRLALFCQGSALSGQPELSVSRLTLPLLFQAWGTRMSAGSQAGCWPASAAS